MRDYLYIPLGGNKVSGARLYFNLWVVFLISGFWHGAEWTFILWGAYHGFFLAIERLFFLKMTSKIGTYARVALTFFIVVFGWVLFRAQNTDQALNFVSKMFSFSFKEFYFTPHLTAILWVAAFLSFFPLFKKVKDTAMENGAVVLSTNRTALTILVVLIGKVYGHLAATHSKQQARRVVFNS